MSAEHQCPATFESCTEDCAATGCRRIGEQLAERRTIVVLPCPLSEWYEAIGGHTIREKEQKA